MRNLRKILAGIVAVVTMAVTAAYALTIPPTYSPRQFPSQQTHYIRFVVNFNDCIIGSVFAGSCSLKRGAVPYNAFIVRGLQQIMTNFNSGTTDTIAIGTVGVTAAGLGSSANLVAAQSVHSGAGNMSSLTIASSGSGIQVTGNGTTPTSTGGAGFDIFTTYTQTGAAASAGQAVIILEYFAPNDGVCVPTPIDSTGAAGFTLQSVC